MTDLNDLLYVAAVAQSGSLAAAARALHVNHATVFRRIAQVEKELGVRLFERSGGRYVATAAGEELAQAGAAVQRTAEQSLRHVAGRDLRPSGMVRITTTDSIATSLLNPVVAICRAQHPQITLQIDIHNTMRDLAKRDADIAVRTVQKPPEYLVGKCVSSLAFAVYGQANYLDNSVASELVDHPWIALGESYERHPSLKWLQKLVTLEQVGLRVDGFAGVARACVDGLGLAVLPCFLGDSAPQLRRLQDSPPDLATELWVLTHPDLHKTARVKAIFQILHHELTQRASLLQGVQQKPRLTATKTAQAVMKVPVHVGK